MARKVFKKGKPIITLGILAAELEAVNWVYLYDAPKHPQIILNMKLNTVLGFLKRGQLSYAIRR